MGTVDNLCRLVLARNSQKYHDHFRLDAAKAPTNFGLKGGTASKSRLWLSRAHGRRQKIRTDLSAVITRGKRKARLRIAPAGLVLRTHGAHSAVAASMMR